MHSFILRRPEVVLVGTMLDQPEVAAVIILSTDGHGSRMEHV